MFPNDAVQGRVFGPPTTVGLGLGAEGLGRSGSRPADLPLAGMGLGGHWRPGMSRGMGWSVSTSRRTQGWGAGMERGGNSFGVFSGGPSRFGRGAWPGGEDRGYPGAGGGGRLSGRLSLPRSVSMPPSPAWSPGERALSQWPILPGSTMTRSFLIHIFGQSIWMVAIEVKKSLESDDPRPEAVALPPIHGFATAISNAPKRQSRRTLPPPEVVGCHGEL